MYQVGGLIAMPVLAHVPPDRPFAVLSWDCFSFRDGGLPCAESFMPLARPSSRAWSAAQCRSRYQCSEPL